MFVCRIVVGSLDVRCANNVLEAAFKRFGVISVLHRSDVNRAVINYSCPDAAWFAILRMNLVTLQGCRLSVSISTVCQKIPP